MGARYGNDVWRDELAGQRTLDEMPRVAVQCPRCRSAPASASGDVCAPCAHKIVREELARDPYRIISGS